MGVAYVAKIGMQCLDFQLAQGQELITKIISVFKILLEKSEVHKILESGI